MRALFVGRTRYSTPLAPTHAQKFAAVGGLLEYRVLGSAAPGAASDERFRLVRPVSPRVLDGPLFYGLLPIRIARELRDFRPDAVLAQSPYEGAAALVGRRLAGVRAKVVVEIHGDWKTSTRLYGGAGRAFLGPIGDAVAAWAVRRADAVRTVSEFTASLVRELGVEPAAIFHTYTDIGSFLEHEPVALPKQPHAAYVGVLERYKNIDGLAAAWRLAAPRLPGVTLELVGRGSRTHVVEALLADLPEQTVWHERLEPPEVSALLDRSTCLVLPSFSEGLPRVVIESFARGRPVVGSRGGGIPDAVEDGRNGLLVPVDDAPALADALVRMLGDGELAGRLAAGARPSAERLLTSPDEYARRVLALVQTVGG